MKNKPVVVEYKKDAAPSDLHPVGVRKGAMFQVKTPAVAKKVHPDATILRYADGEAFVEDSPKPKKKSSTRRRSTRTARTTAPDTSGESQTNDSPDSGSVDGSDTSDAPDAS